MSNEELTARIQAGVDVADNMLRLWEQTKDFIRCVARRYRGLAELEDLEQEGYLALYDAVDGFCQEQGCKFLTYAGYWLRLRMERYVDNCCQAVRVPVHEQQRLQQYRKVENAFRVCLGRKPTGWEMACNLGLDESQVRDLESALRVSRVGSLDSALQDGEDGDTLGDVVPCEVDVAAYVLEGLEERQLSVALQEAMRSLPEVPAEVLRIRYREGRTVRETGQVMGLSESRVRSIEFKALQGLRCDGRLRAYLPEELEAQAYRHNGIGEFNRTWESSTERVAMKLVEKCH